VNDLLYPDCEQGMFVTAVYAVLDTVSGRLVYANAGHNPPLVVHREPTRRKGKPKGSKEQQPGPRLQRLTRTGIALGVVEHAEITESSVDLLPGETLVLYTDGITEAFSPDGQIYSEERLQQVLVESKAASAVQVLDEIDAAVTAFIAEAPIADDLTMVGVRRAG
jgi:sigma-B regulation protein RsbU (phosphoserine phosphatase)